MRLTSLALLVIVSLAARTASAADVSYRLTSENTEVEWTGRKPKGKHDGGFKKVSGVATIVEGKGLKIDIEMDCKSIYSDNFLLTQHLKMADFFSVKKFPKAVFRSSRIEQAEDNRFNVFGELTLLGQKVPIKFPAAIAADDSLRLKATFNLNRRDFGMNHGDGKIDDLVEVRVVVNARRGAN